MKTLSAILGVCALSLLTLAAHAENHTRTLKLNNGTLNLTLINKSPTGGVGFAGMYMTGILGEPGAQYEWTVAVPKNNSGLNFYGIGLDDHCDVYFEPKGKSVVVTSIVEHAKSDCDIDTNGVLTIEFRNLNK